jgi:hypothetical protein
MQSLSQFRSPVGLDATDDPRGLNTPSWWSMRSTGLSAIRGVLARDVAVAADLFGGNLGSELLYAIALGATSLAYGVHLNVAELVFVNTAASVL